MRQTRIQPGNPKPLLRPLSGIRMAVSCHLRQPYSASSSLFLLRLPTLRNIRGVCPGKAIYIASIRLTWW